MCGGHRGKVNSRIMNIVNIVVIHEANMLGMTLVMRACVHTRRTVKGYRLVHASRVGMASSMLEH